MTLVDGTAVYLALYVPEGERSILGDFNFRNYLTQQLEDRGVEKFINSYD